MKRRSCGIAVLAGFAIAGATLSAASALTNASGIASITATANATAGSFNVVSTVSGVAGSATFALISTASGGSGTSATFLGADNVTQGNWKSVYGSQGYFIPNLATGYPAYATVTYTGTPYTWDPNPAGTESARALERVVPPGRFASAVIGDTQVQFDINLTDGLTHRVAFYMTDWQSSTSRPCGNGSRTRR